MSSIYDSTNILVFDNQILREKLEEQLITHLDMSQFITTDYSLQATPGMKIEVHTYHGTGDVEDLAMGAGNTGDIGAYYTTETYDVATTQGRVPYYDEQQMNDPTAIDKAIKHLSEQMTNDITTKVVAELGKAPRVRYGFDYTFDKIVEAISAFPKEGINGLFLLVARKDVALFQKNLKNYLSYVEDYVRTGAIGSIAGVPIYPTDAVATGTCYLANKEAVTCFVKKGVEVSQERSENDRKTTIYGRNVKVIALTNADSVMVLTITSNPYTAVTPVGTENPSTQGWYELNTAGDIYFKTTDTTVDSEKTYYAKS